MPQPWPHIHTSSLSLALVERNDYGQDAIWPNRGMWCQHGAPLSSPAPITSSDISHFFGFQFFHHFLKTWHFKNSTTSSLFIKYNISNITTSIDCLYSTLFLYSLTATPSCPRKNSSSKISQTKLDLVVLSSTPTHSPENPFS